MRKLGAHSEATWQEECLKKLSCGLNCLGKQFSLMRMKKISHAGFSDKVIDFPEFSPYELRNVQHWRSWPHTKVEGPLRACSLAGFSGSVSGLAPGFGPSR
ncbi:hypothetical protein [Desulfonatronum thioautotrophicum]|uniref:hypothetical protein n=1 Tax=Desulfonatronum thioautotrophicum TaxID=617001 RepID=UPI00129469A5|nr:hypothetical protein [Desulfonatronum thioautotrophicum]